MKKISCYWYSLLAWLIRELFFYRVRILNQENFSHTSPVLYVGLHRNGATDGWLYLTSLPRYTLFMLAKQLRKNILGKLFFTGIEVVRDKDNDDRSQNQQALKNCLDKLSTPQDLFIFPEGTSSLGPQHLPFKKGAARIIENYLSMANELKVIPMSIHYERAWTFASKVEIVVGEAINFNTPDNIFEKLQTNLENIGVNVKSDEYQNDIQQLAIIAALDNKFSYYQTLKKLEKNIPLTIKNAHENYFQAAKKNSLWKFHDVPIYPLKNPIIDIVISILTSLIILCASCLNFAPLIAAMCGSYYFADAQNVITLWRILIGIPILLLWFLFIVILSITMHHSFFIVIYLLFTYAGCKLFYWFKRCSVASINFFLNKNLRQQFVKLREMLLEY